METVITIVATTTTLITNKKGDNKMQEPYQTGTVEPQGGDEGTWVTVAEFSRIKRGIVSKRTIYVGFTPHTLIYNSLIPSYTLISQ